ncbi:unnamed protein product [Cunninghamella echinulata]
MKCLNMMRMTKIFITKIMVTYNDTTLSEEETADSVIQNNSLTKTDLKELQTKKTTHVSSLIDKSTKITIQLLRLYHWNTERLLDDYFNDFNKVQKIIGINLSRLNGNHSLLSTIRPASLLQCSFQCSICLDDDTNTEVVCTTCGHFFCVSCYYQYIKEKITNGFYAGIECMHGGCNLLLEDPLVYSIIDKSLGERYMNALNDQFVNDMKNLKWCPFPNCDYVIEHPNLPSSSNLVIPIVDCACGNRFCFGCDMEDHRPAPCYLVKIWIKKMAEHTPSLEWIVSNTKPCPFCFSPIEKRGGCQHMTCRKCHKDFCWVCLGDWNKHQGGSWCNQYLEKNKDKAQQRLHNYNRYIHYHDRYKNHEDVVKLSKRLCLDVENKMAFLQKQKNIPWIDTQVLLKAAHLTIETRTLLKWTYVFAFYVEESNESVIFEVNISYIYICFTY